MSVRPDLRLAVIVGSTREGRTGPVVADWFGREVIDHGEFDLDLIDLAQVDLPIHLPSRYSPAQQAYVDRLAAADAVVVVTPEYNHGYPASLKQAIDLAHDEWARKPIGIVSYGARSGGIRAAEQLRQVFPELEAMTIRESIAIANVWDAFDESGTPVSAAGMAAAARSFLDQLSWWARALATARSEDEAQRLSA